MPLSCGKMIFMETQNQEVKSSATPQPEYLKMYEISGQDAIALHSFERYQRDKEGQKKTIEYVSLNSASYRREMIQNAPLNEKASLIRDGLENGNIEVKNECAMMINSLLDGEQEELREKVFLLVEKELRGKNTEKQKTLAEMIPSAPKEKISVLIETGFESGDPEVQKACAKNIRHISDAKKKEHLREKLSAIIRARLQNNNEDGSGKTYASMIEYAPDKDKASLVKTGLLSNNAETQKECAFAVDHVSDSEKISLVEIIFASSNTEIQKICAPKIQNLPKEKRASLLGIGLSGGDAELAKKCASLIPYADEDRQSELREMIVSLIKESFIGHDAELQTEYAGMIIYAPIDKQSLLRDAVAMLAKKGMAEGDEEAKKIYATMIWNAPKEKMSDLIEEGMRSGNEEAEQMSAYAITYASDKDKAPLIEKGLRNRNVGVQRRCVSLIYSAPKETRALLIQIGLESEDSEVQKKCAAAIPYASKENQNKLRDYIALVAEQILASGNAELQKKSLWMVVHVAEGRRASIINMGLHSEHEEVRKESARMIACVPKEEKRSLFETAKKTVGEHLIEPPLYQHGKVSQENFSREKFIKTGSGTTLLGGELKSNTIIRHMELKPFMVWQKLYEDYELWKDAGFDYVPIEPIQSFKTKENGLVDAYSGVLDLSLRTWEDMSGDFASELEKDREKIRKVLRDNAMVHGHPHDNNFCLRFFRNENGDVDFNKKPRIYLIDFDMAESQE